MNKFDEEKEKILYEKYMEEQGFIKRNNQYILAKYPTQKSYKEERLTFNRRNDVNKRYSSYI